MYLFKYINNYSFTLGGRVCTALSKYNSHTIKFTHKVYDLWILVHCSVTFFHNGIYTYSFLLLIQHFSIIFLMIAYWPLCMAIYNYLIIPMSTY